MRIISKHKDYYDGIQSLGFDETIVYERKEERRKIPELENFNSLFTEFIDYGRTYEFYKKPRDYNDKFIHTVFILGFCGYIYVGNKFDYIKDKKLAYSKCFYSEGETIKFVKEISKSFTTDQLTWKLRFKSWNQRWQKLNRAKKKPEIEDYFKLHNRELLSKKYLEWFHKIHEPVFLFPTYPFSNEEIDKLGWNLESPKSNFDVIVNPNLKKLNFQSQKDAYTCFQDIQQFISGVLGNKEDIKNNSTDIEKVKQHGFDEKYGFRKRPK